ncbi:hypothetical protein KIN20_014231 [Parelaphostrongylus tenuis]|uniref:Lipid droplet-associated hydrolase n=1 Tax=Parelaphostrongylus tenuis TaxID=148309 RepID=A0AAD5MGT7_PARTN|nr:hypothetical protein KIN20_014231 [Parelaphostrongylus tenuis]
MDGSGTRTKRLLRLRSSDFDKFVVGCRRDVRGAPIGMWPLDFDDRHRQPHFLRDSVEIHSSKLWTPDVFLLSCFVRSNGRDSKWRSSQASSCSIEYKRLACENGFVWLDYLPEYVKKWLVSWNLSSEAVPSDVIISATELLSMNVFRNIIHLSHDELNKELLYFYYGRADGWCPEDFGYRMAERLPRGHVILDEDGCEHAFVIRDSAIIAEKLLQFIK